MSIRARPRAALLGLFGSGKVEIEWTVGSATLPKTAVKVLLNLAMTAGDTLLRGGRLNVAAETGTGAIELAVRAEGPRVLLDAEIRRALEGQAPAEGLGPRTAVGFLVHTLVSEHGGHVLVSEPEPGVLLLGVTLKSA